ncbi:hypothetical protein Btru_046119 [Bulinus truncatus]|nr:hypothetical protein Btru_046119 [Bulinus truncatus]
MPETGNGRTTRPATNQRSRRPSVATSDVSRKENARRRSELPNDVTITDRHVTPDELFGPGSPEKPSPDESIVNEGGRKVSGRPQTRAQDVRSVHSLAADQTSPLTSVSKYHTPPQDSANTAVSALGDSGPPSNRGGGASSMDGRNTAGAGVGVNGFLPVRNVNPPRYEPRHSSLSNRSSLYHSGIVDENLMISNTKLDSTLLMMFAQDPYPHWGGGAPLAATPSIAGGQSDEISMAPVMWRVHPMDPVQKETLEREMTFIVDRVNPLDIVDGLSRLGVLTSMDINQLNRIQGQGGKAVTRLMVKTLQRRGQKAYPAFLQALQSRGYLDVCERVMESERALRHGMRMEKPLTDWDSYNRLSPPYHTSPAFRKKLSPLPTDYNQYPLYSTFPLNAFSPLYTSPLSEPATFAYPVASSQMNGFTGRLSPLLQEPIKLSQTVQEPIKLNHIERQLDVLKDELKDLHQDMRDLKSALRQGHQDTRPDEGKHGATPVPEHHHKTPQRGDSPHHERIGGATPTGAAQGAPPGEPNEVTVMLSPEQVKAYKVIEAQQLNQHLRGLQDEVRALHDDVTALSTSRSVKDGRRTRTDWSLGGDDRPTPLESSISKSYPEPQTPHTIIDRQGSFFTINPLQKGDNLPRRNTHRDCDPLPTPRSVKKMKGQGAGGKNQDRKAERWGRPARVSHESHDPLPKPPDSLDLEKSINEPSDSVESPRAPKKISVETSKKNTPRMSGASGGDAVVKPKAKTKIETAPEKVDAQNTHENRNLSPKRTLTNNDHENMKRLTDNDKFSSSKKGEDELSKVTHTDKQSGSIPAMDKSGHRKTDSGTVEIDDTRSKQTEPFENSEGKNSSQNVNSDAHQIKQLKDLNNRESQKSNKAPLSVQDKENCQPASPKHVQKTDPSHQPLLTSRDTVKQIRQGEGRGSPTHKRSSQVSLIKQKVKDESTGYYDTYSQTEASSDDHKPIQPATGLKPESLPTKEVDYANVGQLTSDLQSKVRTLKEEIAALRAQKNAETSRSQPDSSRREQETQAHRLDRQLGDLYGQLRTLRGDVSQLKSEKQKRVVIAEPGSSDGQTKTKPVDAAHQVRPVTTRQTNLPVKQQAPDDRRRSSPAHLSPDDTEGASTAPRRSSEGDKLDTSNRGSRITTPSAILLPPADGATKSRRITSPHTVLPDQSLPWPEKSEQVFSLPFPCVYILINVTFYFPTIAKANMDKEKLRRTQLEKMADRNNRRRPVTRNVFDKQKRRQSGAIDDNRVSTPSAGIRPDTGVWVRDTTHDIDHPRGRSVTPSRRPTFVVPEINIREGTPERPSSTPDHFKSSSEDGVQSPANVHENNKDSNKRFTPEHKNNSRPRERGYTPEKSHRRQENRSYLPELVKHKVENSRYTPEQAQHKPEDNQYRTEDAEYKREDSIYKPEHAKQRPNDDSYKTLPVQRQPVDSSYKPEHVKYKPEDSIYKPERVKYKPEDSSYKTEYIPHRPDEDRVFQTERTEHIPNESKYHGEEATYEPEEDRLLSGEYR